MTQKALVAALFTLLISFTAFGQATIQSRTYPQKYFRYPLDLPPSTAGGFAELRPNHFHSGLDFRTNQRSGYPVHAAADGYVSRIHVQFGGGGNILYVNHPNGYTTVYMHNQQFSAAIMKVLREYQYLHQQFDVDFVPEPGRIPVCQGDVIAISGSSGAVEGPHVHFEIRDTNTEETINPQLFGITIPDRVPPTISGIAIYNLDHQPFSEQTKHEFFPVVGKDGAYRLSKPTSINVSGEIGFGVSAVDMNNASANRNGIYSLELKVDGRTVYTFAAERFAFNQTHAINAYIDYPTHLTTGRFIQKCFILPGSHVSLYPQSVNRGIVNFDDDNEHDIVYIVKDVVDNTSTLNFKVRSQKTDHSVAILNRPGVLFHYDKPNVFDNGKVKVTVNPGNLYDDVNFMYSESPMLPGAFSSVHHIHNRFTPVHDHYDIWIKPDRDLGKYADKAVIAGSAVCDSNRYVNGYVQAQAKGFGDYYIKVDTIPPVITPVNIAAATGKKKTPSKKISLRIGDNLSGIKTYKGFIDGKWVLMEWDFKTKILSYTFDDELPPGKHKFELVVTDNVNNMARYSADFNR
jgi:murein DD-endopeptidase MepM/ murein hydrolase activator NlpD